MGTSNKLAARESPTKKCAGVIHIGSEGSDDKGVNGREFKHASARVRRVDSSSNVIFTLPNNLPNNNFIDFTAASHKPPKCGEHGGIKCHDRPTLAKAFFTLFKCPSD